MGRPQSKRSQSVASNKQKTSSNSLRAENSEKKQSTERDFHNEEEEDMLLGDVMTKMTIAKKSNRLKRIPSSSTEPMDVDQTELSPFQEPASCSTQQVVDPVDGDLQKNVTMSESTSETSSTKTRPIKNSTTSQGGDSEKVKTRVDKNKKKTTVEKNSYSSKKPLKSKKRAVRDVEDEEDEGSDDESNEPPPKCMSDDPAIRRRQCEQCFMLCCSKEKLTRHRLIHTDRGQSMCPYCKTTIKFQYNLKNHMLKCSAKIDDKFGLQELRELYPDFMKQMDLARKYPHLPLPDLPPQWTLHDDGRITGYDPRLRRDADLLARNPSESQNIGKKQSLIDKDYVAPRHVKRNKKGVAPKTQVGNPREPSETIQSDDDDYSYEGDELRIEA